MSAMLDEHPRYRSMTSADLELVVALELKNYEFPWTRGNFSDSLAAGYLCWIVECAGEFVGYSVVATGAGEAHLLNLSIAPTWQHRGLGRAMLDFVTERLRELQIDKIYLEVRLSNAIGRRLYARAGFRELGTRRGYYPAAQGREDAMVMELPLTVLPS